jgi:hypothetical protein
MSYAVRTVPVLLPDPQAGFASGTAEETRSFSQKNSQSEFFCEKGKKYHAAAGESGRSSR